MNEKEIIHINGIREDLYQAMQIGSITLSPQVSADLYNFMNYQDKEIERLNNKIKEQSLLLIEFQDMEQKVDIYRSRCKKAIEYINEHTLFVNGGIIKNILKGVDKND